MIMSCTSTPIKIQAIKTPLRHERFSHAVSAQKNESDLPNKPFEHGTHFNVKSYLLRMHYLLIEAFYEQQGT